RNHPRRVSEQQRGGARREECKQIEARRHLAKAGEMMLDHEARGQPECLGLDVILDEGVEALRRVDIRAAALGLCRAEQSEFHAPSRTGTIVARMEHSEIGVVTLWPAAIAPMIATTINPGGCHVEVPVAAQLDRAG